MRDFSKQGITNLTQLLALLSLDSRSRSGAFSRANSSARSISPPSLLGNQPVLSRRGRLATRAGSAATPAIIPVAVRTYKNSYYFARNSHKHLTQIVYTNFSATRVGHPRLWPGNCVDVTAEQPKGPRTKGDKALKAPGIGRGKRDIIYIKKPKFILILSGFRLH